MSEPSQQAARSGRAVIEVRGADRVRWLNGLVTCNLSKLREGVAMDGLIVGRKGKILTDLVVLQSAEEPVLWLDVDAEARAGVLEHLEHHLIMEDVELAASALQSQWRLGGAPGDAPRGGERPAQGLVRGAVDWRWALGEPAPTLPAWELALELSAGLPRFRRDYDDSFYPQEAGLDGFAVAFDKGCYLGQEVVFMLHARGKVKRRLALLELVGDELPAAGSEVQRDGVAVGAVKVAGSLQPLGAAQSSAAPRAFALLNAGAWAPGTALRVGSQAATVLG